MFTYYTRSCGCTWLGQLGGDLAGNIMIRFSTQKKARLILIATTATGSAIP
jgi:hypothetical protein